jgi:hypothetical protein
MTLTSLCSSAIAIHSQQVIDTPSLVLSKVIEMEKLN